MNEKAEHYDSIQIAKIDGRCFLDVNGVSMELKDYKISSSMHGGTELELVLNVGSPAILQFEMTTR